MRMQKEEKIVVVLLLMALGSLAVAFWAFGLEEVTDNSAAAKKDASLYVEGLVLEMKPTSTGGNLLLRLDSTPLSVFVPRARVQERSRRMFVLAIASGSGERFPCFRERRRSR